MLGNRRRGRWLVTPGELLEETQTGCCYPGVSPDAEARSTSLRLRAAILAGEVENRVGVFRLLIQNLNRFSGRQD